MIITKTDFVNFMHCPKYTFLDKNNKELKGELSESNKQNIAEGHEVGYLAHKLSKFAGGVLVPFDRDLEKNVAVTESTMLDNPKYIFEAAFMTELASDLQLFARCDIIEFLSETDIILYEVKSASTINSRHLNDILFQRFVLEACGYNVIKTFIVSPNQEYVREDHLNPDKFFKFVEQSNENYDSVEVFCIEYKKAASVMPKCISTGSKCHNPFSCPFADHCEEKCESLDSIENLSRLSEKKRTQLNELGVTEIKNIPEKFELTPRQSIQRIASITNKPFIDYTKLEEFLSQIKYPIYDLDFETSSKAIPMFKGMSPHEHLPFQASVHKTSKNGEVSHFAFVKLQKEDPREELIKFLISTLGKSGTIISWHASFERSRLLTLSEQFPEYREELLAIVDRLLDLEDPFSKTYYYRMEFQGSSSIKYVLPVLVPDLSYKMLAIQNGGEAQALYKKAIYGEYTEQEIKEFQDMLNDYCCLDTLAMKRIREFLFSLFEESEIAA